MEDTDIQPKSSKLKKCIKRFFIGLGCIIWFVIVRLFSFRLFAFIFWTDLGFWDDWAIVVYATIIAIVLISFVLWLIKLIKSKRNKKAIKWYFVADSIIIFLMILCWLTKAWIIPNWLDIEALCPFNWDTSILKWYKCQQTATYNYWCCNSVWFCVNYLDYPDWVMKPIIYIYPTQETEVNVTLWTPENLSHTYPKYNSEKWWNVVAEPNGDLEDRDTWRKLYALYREWKTYAEDNFEEWFVVKWEDIIPFLEEKLAILWLNEREAEEFIVYWLPKMENNEYNLIRFETKEEQDENMPLNITPEPDTVIRVMMDRKAMDEPIDIPEQELTAPERTWFTVVERWGSPRN